MGRWTLLAAMAAVWALAVEAWPALPERIPLHFDAAGRPDGYVARSPWAWFALPALASGLGAALGWLLPWFTAAQARRNSPYLNLPDAARFRALPEAARLRAVAPVATALRGIALLLQGLFGWIVWGTAAVARGERATLAPWPVSGFVAGVVAVVVWLLFASRRAVAREVGGGR